MNREYKVWFVKKNNRYNEYERITHIGGLTEDCYRWSIPLREAIAGIECGRWGFFIKRNGTQVRVIVAETPSGSKYLKTEIDADLPELLLSLPEK